MHWEGREKKTGKTKKLEKHWRKKPNWPIGCTTHTAEKDCLAMDRACSCRSSMVLQMISMPQHCLIPCLISNVLSLLIS